MQSAFGGVATYAYANQPIEMSLPSRLIQRVGMSLASQRVFAVTVDGVYQLVDIEVVVMGHGRGDDRICPAGRNAAALISILKPRQP
jgi:hypothetical protein